MVEDDQYCIDILTQSKAVERSLEKIDALLLEDHLSHCVVEHVRAGRTQKAVQEVMKVFERRL